MISFTPNREDVLLMRAFAGDIGFYVDIGAHRPEHGSTTKALSDAGWKGINVEANPALLNEFIDARPNDISLNFAVSDDDSEVPFYVVDKDIALSTMDVNVADEYVRRGLKVRKINVPGSTLDNIISKYCPDQSIDLLKIDVEGAEEQVLRGTDLDHWRPKVLVIEATEPYRFVKTHEKWEHLINNNLYEFCLFDGVNRIYALKVESELVESLSWPVCTLDRFQSLEGIDADKYRKFGRLSLFTANSVQRIVDILRRNQRR